jgi:hypothetical protein
LCTEGGFKGINLFEDYEDSSIINNNAISRKNWEYYCKFEK